MITATQNGSLYEIRFPYDPNLVELVKTVPGRWYHPEGKYWSVPLDKLGFFQSRLAQTPYYTQLKIISQENIGQNEAIEFTEVTEIPDIDISGITYHIKNGCNPFNHQLDTLKYEIDRKQRGIRSGFILADMPGLGKTLQVINLALYNKEHEGAKHCLIVACINSAKHNWVSDIAKHTNGEYEGYLLGSRLNKKGELKPDQTGEDKYLDLKTGFKYGNEAAGPLPYFLIVNIEAFRYKDKNAKKNKDAFTCELIHQIQEGNINMIALDEIHRNASPTSQQGKEVIKVKKAIQDECDIEWIPMTGTPIVNNPLDVFLPLKLVNGHQCNSYYEWSREYCVYGGYGGHEVISYKNIPKLKMLLQPNMLRRKREDVLDLPPKIEMIEYVENSDHQKKLYAKILNEMNKEKDSIRVSLNPMTAFLRLRQINGAPEIVDPLVKVDSKYLSKNAKIKRALELIDEIIANDEKVVVFSNWVETLKPLYKILEAKHIKTCVYTGTMKQDLREQHKEVFMNNPEYHVILGTIGALGTSHTLTAATNEIFLDEPWSPAVKGQAEDRCLTGETIVTTPKGFVPIKDISVGDYVYTPQGNIKKVIDCWSHTEEADLVEIQFYGDPEPIVCTADHKILIDDLGWVQASDIISAKEGSHYATPKMYSAFSSELTTISTRFSEDAMYGRFNQYGSYQRIGNKHPIPETISVSSDFLYFLGYYLGDGTTSDAGQMQLAGNISNHKIVSLTRIQTWYKSIFEGACTLKYEKEGNGVTLYITNTEFSRFIMREVGRTSHDKHLPDWCDKLSKDQLHHLFDGLMDSDGWRNVKDGQGDLIYLTTTSSIASGVWWLMSKLGYKPRIEKRSQKDYDKSIYTISSRVGNKYRLKSGRVRSVKHFKDTVNLYDITVEDDNSFYCWGTPVHNCYRIGTTQSVTIYTLLCQGTVDDKVHDILFKKQGSSDFIVDNMNDALKNHPEMLDWLLS